MIAFAIQQMPDGKWRLTKHDVDMGVFPTQEAAEAGIGRIVKSVVLYYDEAGSPIP